MIKLYIEKFWILILGLVLILFFFLKYQQLHLPPLWDDLWVYYPAIKKMALIGPNLFPGTMDPEIYSGHPLLFMFLAASWMKFFGESLFAINLFPFIISCCCILLIYFIVKKYTNTLTALFGVLLYVIEPLLIVQSSLLLMELFLAGLMIASLYFFINKKYILFCLVSVAALWTKETAYVLLPSIGIYIIIDNSIVKYDFKTFIKECLIIVFITFLGGAFFLLHKYHYGWYLFPRHIGLLDFNIESIINKSSYILELLFFEGYKKFLFFINVFALIALIIFGELEMRVKRLVLIFLIFTVCLIAFSSINFFTVRYISSIYFILIIITGINIYYFTNRSWIRILLAISVLFLQSLYLIENKKLAMPYDHHLNYSALIRGHQGAVNYLNKHASINDCITADFLGRVVLTEPKSGYVNSPYINVSGDITSTTKYYLCTDMDGEYLKKQLINYSNNKIVYSFNQNNFSVKVFKLIE